MERVIKFQLIHDKEIVGYERLTEKGWQWMWLELNPDKGERWVNGVLNPESYAADIIRRQFTGLLDKNGKEIYEGDIVKVGYLSGLHVVIWDNEDAGFRMKRNEPSSMRGMSFFAAKDKYPIIVIGNIYENPELLK